MLRRPHGTTRVAGAEMKFNKGAKVDYENHNLDCPYHRKVGTIVQRLVQKEGVSPEETAGSILEQGIDHFGEDFQKPCNISSIKIRNFTDGWLDALPDNGLLSL